MTGDAVGMLVLGGAAASALALGASRSRSTADLTPTTAGTWVFPVPSIGDRVAVISNEFKADAHLGVDLMFKRRDTRDVIAVYPPGSTSGSKWFFMPESVAALAASAGTVTFSAMTPQGNSVIVQHPNGWTTYYTHLATLAVRKAQAVAAGQVLGTIGASPKDSAHLSHLLCGAAHKRCYAERHVMRSAGRRRAITRNPRRLRLHITETSRRSR